MFKFKPLNKKGFSHVEMIVFAVVILAIGGIGYYALKGSKAETPVATSNSSAVTNKEKMVIIAKKELGIKEPSSRICVYQNFIAGQEGSKCSTVPWSTFFVGWVYEKAYKDDFLRRIGRASDMLTKTKKSNKWIVKKIDKNTQLAPGDIVLRVGAPNASENAGIIKTLVKSGNNKGMLTVINGNYNDQVKENVCSMTKGTCSWTYYLRRK